MGVARGLGPKPPNFWGKFYVVNMLNPQVPLLMGTFRVRTRYNELSEARGYAPQCSTWSRVKTPVTRCPVIVALHVNSTWATINSFSLTDQTSLALVLLLTAENSTSANCCSPSRVTTYMMLIVITDSFFVYYRLFVGDSFIKTMSRDVRRTHSAATDHTQSACSWLNPRSHYVRRRTATM